MDEWVKWAGSRYDKLSKKVKVRDEAQDVDEDDYATRFCKALDALSLHNFPSPPGGFMFTTGVGPRCHYLAAKASIVIF
ncbi:hypothetical protein DCAR_0935736 [Daucus carota subsp. sativus]|uniref:Uncharacterized protein n=1 Tax=Daucus carota subsp. sativus TaxID=79200 RepID=A0A175YK12_DAUCS|nr:hypothetical protein DCAR_0935736 [Daucus carota subsp. sativus]